MPTVTLPARARTRLVATVSAALALAGTACSGARTTDDTAATSVPVSGPVTSTSAPRHTTPREDRMRIQITIGEQRFGATLSESDASRDLVAQLPMTLDLDDHGQVEKTGPLPSPLSLAGQPDGADPDVGDLGYYAPGNDLVLYYGDQSFFPGIVVLGRLDGDAAQRLSVLDGTVTARVEVADD